MTSNTFEAYEARMGAKPRVAFCFYGHPRTFRDNVSLVPNLLERYPGDVFVHIYPMLDLGPHQQAWHVDRAGTEGERITEADIAWLHMTYPGIVRFEVDPQDYSTAYIPPFAQKFGGRHSGAEVQKLRREHEKANGFKYDIVFRVRFDLVFNEPFVLPADFDAKTLYGAYNLTAIENGVDDDLFNYGSPEVIDGVFGTAIPAEEEALIAGFGFQGEALVTSIRKRAGFKYANHAPMKCGLLRSTGLLEIRI